MFFPPLPDLGVGIAHLGKDHVDEEVEERASLVGSFRPYRAARRRIRRSTYPRPSFDGSTPSANAKTRLQEI